MPPLCCAAPLPPLQGKIFNLNILSRPASFCHNYEYPKLPARPSSETAFTLDEKCLNFINSSNFDDDGKSNVDSVDAATRRISATSSASAASKTSTLELSAEPRTFFCSLATKVPEYRMSLYGFVTGTFLSGPAETCTRCWTLSTCLSRLP